MEQQIKRIAVWVMILTLAWTTLIGAAWYQLGRLDSDVVDTELIYSSDGTHTISLQQELESKKIELETQKTEYEEQILQLNNEIAELKEDNECLSLELDELKQYEVFTPAEWILLYRVARAEAGANSAEGQMNVIYVVLNRVESEDFPNTVEEVLTQDGQFECVSNKSFYKVEITDFTIENVRLAYENWINGEDAGGALYFGTIARSRTFLFEDEVGHKFYK